MPGKKGAGARKRGSPSRRGNVSAAKAALARAFREGIARGKLPKNIVVAKAHGQKGAGELHYYAFQGNNVVDMGTARPRGATVIKAEDFHNLVYGRPNRKK